MLYHLFFFASLQYNANDLCCQKGAFLMEPKEYMMQALELARQALDTGDVPVGCVVVQGDQVVGRGRNRREEKQNALLHAEIEAINEACQTLGRWRLSDCALYVTLEPCPMCAGAILQSRIPQVFFGARDPKGGAMGGVLDLFWEDFNHRPQVVAGVLEAECSCLLEEFFRTLRESR